MLPHTFARRSGRGPTSHRTRILGASVHRFSYCQKGKKKSFLISPLDVQGAVGFKVEPNNNPIEIRGGVRAVADTWYIEITRNGRKLAVVPPAVPERGCV